MNSVIQTKRDTAIIIAAQERRGELKHALAPASVLPAPAPAGVLPSAPLATPVLRPAAPPAAHPSPNGAPSTRKL